MKKKGFTVIEVMVAILFLIATMTLVIVQKNDIQKTSRDQQRKATVNSIYFHLKDVYYKQNGYYPETITPKTIKGIDPEIFTDPNGILLGKEGSNYRYETENCKDNKCSHFKISSSMEKEADFIREN